MREHNPGKEQALIGNFIEQTNQLETQPRSGQKRETRPDGTGIRSLLLGKHHRVVYAVGPDDAVSILQVFDLRSDQDFYR